MSKDRLRGSTKSNRVENRPSAPSAQPIASPRTQAARPAPRPPACRLSSPAPRARACCRSPAAGAPQRPARLPAARLPLAPRALACLCTLAPSACCALPSAPAPHASATCAPRAPRPRAHALRARSPSAQPSAQPCARPSAQCPSPNPAPACSARPACASCLASAQMGSSPFQVLHTFFFSFLSATGKYQKIYLFIFFHF